MKLLFVLALVASTQAAMQGASGGGVEARVDTDKPWEVDVTREGQFAATNGRFLKLQYSFLGELAGDKSVVPDVPASPIPTFHSIPITNPLLANYIHVTTAATADYAYVGFGERDIPQSMTLRFDGFIINFIALREFDANYWDLPMVNASYMTRVCFAGLMADGRTCAPNTVTAGTLKMAMALRRWTWAASAQYWRLGFTVTANNFGSGMTVTADNITTPEFFNLHFTDPSDGWTFDLKINKKFNRGNNTFAFGESSYTVNGNTATINIDLKRSDLVDERGWFLYDPEVNFRTAGPPRPSSAVTNGVSVLALLVAAVAAIFLA